MNNNTVSNPKQEVEGGISMNDKDYLDSLLSTLKCMEKDYCVALTEASCNRLYNEYKEVFDNISSLQRDTYNLMFKKGWYALEKAESNKIDNKYQMLEQEFTDLGIE